MFGLPLGTGRAARVAEAHKGAQVRRATLRAEPSVPCPRPRPRPGPHHLGRPPGSQRRAPCPKLWLRHAHNPWGELHGIQRPTIGLAGGDIQGVEVGPSDAAAGGGGDGQLDDSVDGAIGCDANDLACSAQAHP